MIEFESEIHFESQSEKDFHAIFWNQIFEHLYYGNVLHEMDILHSFGNNYSMCKSITSFQVRTNIHFEKINIFKNIRNSIIA